MMNKIEIEAKFIIPNIATFKALQQITSLDAFQFSPIGEKIIEDHYLDTPRRQLLEAGFVCRIRHAKGRQTLTLKSAAIAEGEVHRRREIEMEIDSDQPQTWGDGEAKDLILGIIGPDTLQTLFTIYQTRYKFHVSTPEKSSLEERRILELSLDKVSWRQPNTVDYLGLEAELIDSGTDADLENFTKALQRDWSLQIDTQSKFERAWAIHQQK